MAFANRDELGLNASHDEYDHGLELQIFIHSRHLRRRIHSHIAAGMMLGAHVTITSHFLAAGHFSGGHGRSRQARKRRRSGPNQDQQKTQDGTTPRHD
jgi:hypothetical protein